MSVNIFKNNALTKIAQGLKDSVVTITNNLLATKSGTALDAVQGKVLDDKITELNNSLGDQPTFEYDETGKITGYKTKVGADTVFPFKSKAEIEQLNSLSENGHDAFVINNALDYSFFFVVYQYDTSGDYGLNVTNGTVSKMFGWHPVSNQYVAGFIVTPTNDICTIGKNTYFNKRIIYGVK